MVLQLRLPMASVYRGICASPQRFTCQTLMRNRLVKLANAGEASRVRDSVEARVVASVPLAVDRSGPDGVLRYRAQRVSGQPSPAVAADGGAGEARGGLGREQQISLSSGRRPACPASILSSASSCPRPCRVPGIGSSARSCFSRRAGARQRPWLPDSRRIRMPARAGRVAEPADLGPHASTRAGSRAGGTSLLVAMPSPGCAHQQEAHAQAVRSGRGRYQPRRDRERGLV